MVKFYKHTNKLVKRIQKQLGARFPERVLQNALAKEFIDAKIQYEKELNLDILYKKNRVGYITADFFIPKQKKFNLKEDLIIETKQAGLQMKVEYLSQLKIYLKSRSQQVGFDKIRKAMLICWENKDLLDEDESRVKFSTNVRLEVWELSEKKDEMLKIWSA